MLQVVGLNWHESVYCTFKQVEGGAEGLFPVPKFSQATLCFLSSKTNMYIRYLWFVEFFPVIVKQTNLWLISSLKILLKS